MSCIRTVRGQFRRPDSAAFIPCKKRRLQETPEKFTRAAPFPFPRKEAALKRILTIQDISCLGTCSLTIALPVISALGSEAVILPTAVLSTHTMFSNYTYKDLADQIEPIARHWKSEGIAFDAIYTGYLGTVGHIDKVLGLIRDFRGPDTIVFVDPVIGDNGRLYPAFDMAYVRKNTELCAAADIIVPNITEGAFMTGMEYRETHDEAYIKEMLRRLAAFGAKVSALTGVSLEPGMIGVMGYDRTSGEHFTYQRPRIGDAYHSTGDLFSSTCIGTILKGRDWRDAMRIAADYTARTIEVSLRNPARLRYAVDFEKTLPELIAMQ